MAVKLTLEQVLEAIGLSAARLKILIAAAAANTPGGELVEGQINAILDQWISEAQVRGLLELVKAELVAAWVSGKSVVKKDASDLA